MNGISEGLVRENGTVQCKGCLKPLSVQEPPSEAFVAGESCPRCRERAQHANPKHVDSQKRSAIRPALRR